MADKKADSKTAAPPAMPASLLEGGEALPPVHESAFCFGALIMRVTDGGGVNTDVVSGYSYGHSFEAAQADFSTSVQRSFPGWSITKLAGQPVPPFPPVPVPDMAVVPAPPQDE